ncbi:LOW QUALITY PROTEIN: hypothetical protein ACHAW6_003584 [Cyclotella cf. meneghiniana]
MIQKWVMGIEWLVAVATRFPHSAYMGLISCLSANGSASAGPYKIPSLTPVESALHTKFLPPVLGIDGPINDELRTLLGNGVKTGGLRRSGTPPLPPPPLTPHLLRLLTCSLAPSSEMNPSMSRHTVCATGTTHRKTQRTGEVAFHTALMERSLLKVKK